MEAKDDKLTVLKEILRLFSLSTGLKVNFSKSLLVPINMTSETALLLSQSFGFTMGSLPFTYLGLHLCLSKPKVVDFWPLISKCERRWPALQFFYLK